MSYLAEPTSKTQYGVVQIGNFIEVNEAGIVSLLQDLGPEADVEFNKIDVKELTVGSDKAVTSVTPTAGTGIAITSVNTSGYNVTFTVANTGVIKLVAGSGISLSTSSGTITVSSTGADLINTYGTSINYTATIDDEYIGVNSESSVTITLPSGVSGRTYTIKDELGRDSGKITIQPQTGQLIDGKSNYVISVDYQSVNLVFRGGKWWII